MDSRTLYVGLDSTQYSNRMFTDGKTKEICVAVFSTDPQCLLEGIGNRKRDPKILVCNP